MGETRGGAEAFGEDNLSKERAAVYFGQIGAKVARRRN